LLLCSSQEADLHHHHNEAKSWNLVAVIVDLSKFGYRSESEAEKLRN